MNEFYHISAKGNIRRISFESWYRGMNKEISQKRPGLRTSYFDSLKQAQKAAFDELVDAYHKEARNDD